MQTEPTDEILEVIVAARESGVSRRACMEVVADVFAAPWSGPVSSGGNSPNTRGASRTTAYFSQFKSVRATSQLGNSTRRRLNRKLGERGHEFV